MRDSQRLEIHCQLPGFVGFVLQPWPERRAIGAGAKTKIKLGVGRKTKKLGGSQLKYMQETV